MTPVIDTLNLRFTGMFAALSGEQGFGYLLYNATTSSYHAYAQFSDVSSDNICFTGTYKDDPTWSDTNKRLLIAKVNHKTKTTTYSKSFLTDINFYRGAGPAHAVLDSSENFYFGFNTDPYPSGGGATENRPFLGKVDSSGTVSFTYDRNADRSQMAVYSLGIFGSDAVYVGHSNPGASGIFWVDTTSGSTSNVLKTMTSGGYANGYTRAKLSTNKLVQMWSPFSGYYMNHLGTDGGTSNIYSVSNATSNWLFSDSSDNVYLAGFNGSSGVIAKTSSGTSVTWSRQYAADTITDCSGAVDADGNVYVVYASRYATSPDRHYSYVCKYNSSGTLQWQKKLSSDFNSSLRIYDTNFKNGCLHMVGYVGNFSSGTRIFYMKLPVTSTPTNQTIAFANGTNVDIANGTGSDSAGSVSLSSSSLSFSNTNYGATNFTSGATSATFTTQTKDIV